MIEVKDNKNQDWTKPDNSSSIACYYWCWEMKPEHWILMSKNKKKEKKKVAYSLKEYRNLCVLMKFLSTSFHWYLLKHKIHLINWKYWVFFSLVKSTVNNRTVNPKFQIF